MDGHTHHWHHNGCHHSPTIGEESCVCGESEPGLYCCGDDDDPECDASA